MAKFLTRLFNGSSSSSKRPSFRSSNTSLNESSRYTGTSSGIRVGTSLENISIYHINSRDLEKNKLHKASWDGKLDKVERLIRKESVNSQDQYLRTPLHLAVVQGHLDIVKRLVDGGASLDSRDRDQRTPLILAVIYSFQNPPRYYQICQTLLTRSGNKCINIVDAHGKDALYYAIECGNINAMTLFVTSPDCNVNYQYDDYMTPLHVAVKYNHPDMVRLLLSDELRTQANPNAKNRDGQTPLHLAAVFGYVDVIRVLFQADPEEPCDPTILDSEQLTPYQSAKRFNQEPCAQIISEYQKGWTNLSPRRERSDSIDEQEVDRPVVLTPPERFQADHNEDNDSSSLNETDEITNSSERHMKPSINTYPERNDPLISVNKQENRTLADLIKHIPLQPDITKTQASKLGNETVTSLVNSVLLQPDGMSTRKSAITAPQKQPSSLSGIIPSISQNQETDRTSTVTSFEKALVDTNLIAGQPSSPKKNVVINSIVNTLVQPEAIESQSTSWIHDPPSLYKQEQTTRQTKTVEISNQSPIVQSDDQHDTNVYRSKTASTTYSVLHSLPGLNGTTMFTTTRKNENVDHSDSDEDSIEVAVRKHTMPPKPSNGIQNLVNQQIGNNYRISPEIPTPKIQSPVSDESSWSISLTASNKDSITKGISALVQQQSLINKKTSELAWDDSRPLSADLVRSSVILKSHGTDSSDESDVEQDRKSATIIKSPLTNGALSSLVQGSIRPKDEVTDKKTNGVLSSLVQGSIRPKDEVTDKKTNCVENLIEIMKAIGHPPIVNSYQPTSRRTNNKFTVSSMLDRHDSLSSNSSSSIDNTRQALPGAGLIMIPDSKQQFYNDETNKLNWHPITNDENDSKFITEIYAIETSQQTQRLSKYTFGHHEFNSLRGSMSSSTSSVQNNMERISELKEDIKQIERKQEDSFELKRQLKDMEIKKNNFEALFKKNDQLLRETETKLEREINEKQRLEWTTKNLNMELKSVKQKLQSLEDEKDVLNQRCMKLKEERDNYDEKLRIHQENSLQATIGVLREEDIEKIKLRHREEMKLLSAENDDLHQRTKQLQSDLQLHKESLDVTIRYKIDLEKAVEEKTFLQNELDRLKHEKESIEQEKIDYKAKYDNLQEEIRVMLADRSKLEQKLTDELQEQVKQRQRSTDDVRKYKTQIEQLNIKLGDAEARLLVLQTRNEALLASKDREIKSEFETLTQRLNMIESEKLNAEQRFRNEQKDITYKQQQQHVLHEPLALLTSTPLNVAVQQQHQNSASSPCTKCDTLQRSYEQEREQRLQTEKDNQRLRTVVSRQRQEKELNKSLQQQEDYEHHIKENSKQLRSETERVRHELERLRHDFGKLVLNYEPPSNLQQQERLHAHIDSLRHFYEEGFRRKQPIISRLTDATNLNCSVCSNHRLLRERLDNAIDISLADQRIQTIRQMPILPRQTLPVSTLSSSIMPSYDLLRKRYYI